MLHVIYLGAGKQQRFLKEGYTTFKGLLPLNKKLVLDYQLTNFINGDTTFHFITTQKYKDEIEKYFEKLKQEYKEHNIYYNIYIIEQNPLGCLASFVDASKELKIDDNDEVIVSYSDFGFRYNNAKFFELLNKKPSSVISYYVGKHYCITNDVPPAAIVNNRSIEKYVSDSIYDTKWQPGFFYFNNYKTLLEVSKQYLKEGKAMNNGEYAFALLFDNLPQFEEFEIDEFYQLGTPQWYEFTKDLLENNELNNNVYKFKTIEEMNERALMFKEIHNAK